MVRMSARPPASFERYVQEAKVPDKEMVKELLPLLDDEPLRLVVQNDLSESADYKAVRDCLQSHYGHEGTEMEWQAKFQTRVHQRLMELVLTGLHWSSCLVYLDDIIIYSRSVKEHLIRLAEVLERLKQAGMKLN